MELLAEQKTVQTLSPQTIQSMRVLQMNAAELQEYLEEQLLDNPVLEQEEPPGQAEPWTADKMAWLADSDRQNRRYYAQDAQGAREAPAAAAQESLYDHLSAQISWSGLTGPERRAVECVLAGLDDNGRLEESPEELAARAGTGPDAVERAEELVRSLEPAGVGARTLSQCLELQLERREERDELALTIVQGHMEDLAKDHYNQIARATGADRAQVQRSCRLIRTLDPRPGAAFSPSEPPCYLYPDLLVREEDGALTVCFLDDSQPSLRLSPYYLSLARENGDAQVRDYLNQKLRQASWVVRNLEQRRDTILRVARCIVARQEGFFRRGREHLLPMTLADVAADAGVHPSTVSRAVKGKYIQCTWGLFPMDQLFRRSLPQSGGQGGCAQQVKALLQALIACEDRGKPLSDQKLCQVLAGQGIEISRRTVAKYRQELGLPPAAGRREF